MFTIGKYANVRVRQPKYGKKYLFINSLVKVSKIYG